MTTGNYGADKELIRKTLCKKTMYRSILSHIAISKKHLLPFREHVIIGNEDNLAEYITGILETSSTSGTAFESMV